MPNTINVFIKLLIYYVSHLSDIFGYLWIFLHIIKEQVGLKGILLNDDFRKTVDFWDWIQNPFSGIDC